MVKISVVLSALAAVMLAPVPEALAQTTGPNARSQPKMLRPPVPSRVAPRPSTRIAPRTSPGSPSLSTAQERDLRGRLRTLDAEYRRRVKSDGKDSADTWLRAREQQIRQEAPGR